MVEIRFHSLGGQGAVTLINLLAKAGDAVGKHVQAFPFFGAERRGAPVRTYLRVDDEPIALRSQIYAPDFLVVMESSLLEAALAEGTKEETVILLNAGKEEAERKTRNLPYTVYCVDATSISVELGMVVEGMAVLNIPFLGAVSYVTEIISLDVVTEVLRKNIPASRLEASMEAARLGFTSVVKVKEAEDRARRGRSAAS